METIKTKEDLKKCLAVGLAVGLALGLVGGLGVIFITNLIALLQINPEFSILSLILSGVLLVLVEVIGWVMVYNLNKVSKDEE